MSPQRYNVPKRRRTVPPSSIIVSEPDSALIVIVAFLVVLGIMAIFSATAQKAIAEGLHPTSYILKQVICLIIGVFAMRFFIKFDYQKGCHGKALFVIRAYAPL